MYTLSLAAAAASSHIVKATPNDDDKVRSDYIDHFSGPGTVIGSVRAVFCVLCIRTITSKKWPLT